MIDSPSELLRTLFAKVCQSASAAYCLPDYLAQIDQPSIILMALGKSAIHMAAVAQEQLGTRICSGLAVTAYGHSVDIYPPGTKSTGLIEIIESAHPVPDANSQYAATRLLNLARSAQADDLVLVLLSGGGSSLAVAPIVELTLEQKQTINRQLLKSGATIDQINSLRKHLSLIKGGRLSLAAQPARVHTLAISDVPANSPQSIASGPTLPDDSSCADCIKIIQQYQLELPQHIIELLRYNRLETPNQDNPAFSNSMFDLIADPSQSLDAIASYAKEMDMNLVNLGADWYQDANDIAAEHCRQIVKAETGTLIVSGGEASVRVTGSGSGGRNGQFLLSLACQLEQIKSADKKVWAIACDTDGIDGSGDNAGCILTPDSMDRARVAGLDPHSMLLNNDSYAFFSALDDLVITGPTGTNVNDFRAIILL